MSSRLVWCLLLPLCAFARLPSPPTPPIPEPVDRPAPTSADRDEELRDHRVFGYTNGQPRGAHTLLHVGDRGLTAAIQTAYISDFRGVFGPRLNRASLPDPSQLEVAEEVLRRLETRLQSEGARDIPARLRALRSHLRHLPPMDDYSARPLRWKETPLANALFTRTQGPYHHTAQASICRQVYYDRLTPEERSRSQRFFEELARLPRAYALYLRSITEPRVWALSTMDELLALPEPERRELAALAHYRRARLCLSLPDWEQATDGAVRRRLRQIRGDLQAIPDDRRAGALDFGQVEANAPGWVAYSYSMVLPARRLTELGEADYPRALAIYLKLPERRHANGFTSIHWLIGKLADESAFDLCARDPDLRMLMTIFLGASPEYSIGIGRHHDYAQETGPVGARGWLEALDAAGIGPEFAPHRVAMLRLQIGDFPGCERILRTLDPRDPLTALISSHCHLKKGGDKEAAMRLLAAALRPDPPGYRPRHASVSYYGSELDLDLTDPRQVVNRIGAELAMLKLAQGDYAEALRLFYAHGDSTDGAYIAECILTSDELRRLVDRHGYRDQPRNDLSDGFYDPEYYLPRELLARRLFREERWEEAAGYFPPELATLARQYAGFRRLAARADTPPRQRADAFWRAALIIHAHGRELLFCPFGLNKTQLDRPGMIHQYPDPTFLEYPNGWYLYLNGFLPSLRLGLRPNHYAQDLAGPTSDEIARLKVWYTQHIEHPNYSERMPRYEVMRLGLLAVKDLPDNDPAGALILQFIGNQLKYADPQAATPAYRALVKRFGQTPLGATATKNRWFAKDRPMPAEDIIR